MWGDSPRLCERQCERFRRDAGRFATIRGDTLILLSGCSASPDKSGEGPPIDSGSTGNREGNAGGAGFGFGTVGSVEDRADIGVDHAAHGQIGEMGSGVLLEVKLAELPGGGVESGAHGGLEAFVGIGGDDDVREADAAPIEGGEKGASMGFGLEVGGGDSGHDTLAVLGPDADGRQHGAMARRALEANLDVGGVQN